MNPMQAMANRTARLVREASTPTYSTSTPKREHLMVIEWESDMGGRYWSKPMPESEFTRTLREEGSAFYFVSDTDHAAKCWCM